MVGIIVIKHLGRTHGRAPGRGWQETSPEFCEKDGVDQLCLAAGELCHKGDGQSVPAQRRQRFIDLVLGFARRKSMFIQPDTVFVHSPDQL